MTRFANVPSWGQTPAWGAAVLKKKEDLNRIVKKWEEEQIGQNKVYKQ